MRAPRSATSQIRLVEDIDRRALLSEAEEYLRVVVVHPHAAVGRRIGRDGGIFVEGDAAGEVTRPRQPDLERHRPRVALLAIDTERAGRRPPTRARGNVNGPYDAVVLDQERKLAAELNLDAAAGHPHPGLGPRCPLEHVDGRGAEYAVAREVRPLLESDHRRRGLRVDRAGQPGGSHEAEVDQSLLDLPRRELLLRGGLDRGPNRLREVIAGEEA